MPFFIFFSGNTLTYMRLAWYKKTKHIHKRIETGSHFHITKQHLYMKHSVVLKMREKMVPQAIYTYGCAICP